MQCFFKDFDSVCSSVCVGSGSVCVSSCSVFLRVLVVFLKVLRVFKGSGCVCKGSGSVCKRYCWVLVFMMVLWCVRDRGVLKGVFEVVVKCLLGF